MGLGLRKVMAGLLEDAAMSFTFTICQGDRNMSRACMQARLILEIVICSFLFSVTVGSDTY